MVTSKGRRTRRAYRIPLEQWFLTFLTPWTPKGQKHFHGSLEFLEHYQWTLYPFKEVLMGTKLYSHVLRGPPRPSPWTPG